MIDKNLELIAINGSVYRFDLTFGERKIAHSYTCRKIKGGETYELRSAVYLAMGLDGELEERTLKLWRKQKGPNSLDVEEIGLAISGEDIKPSERNSANAKKVIELIEKYNAASRVFLTIVFSKGLVLPESRVVYFNEDNQKLVHSGLIRRVRVKK